MHTSQISGAEKVGLENLAIWQDGLPSATAARTQVTVLGLTLYIPGSTNSDLQ